MSRFNFTTASGIGLKYYKQKILLSEFCRYKRVRGSKSVSFQSAMWEYGRKLRLSLWHRFPFQCSHSELRRSENPLHKNNIKAWFLVYALIDAKIIYARMQMLTNACLICTTALLRNAAIILLGPTRVSARRAVALDILSTLRPSCAKVSNQ